MKIFNFAQFPLGNQEGLFLDTSWCSSTASSQKFTPKHFQPKALKSEYFYLFEDFNVVVVARPMFIAFFY